MRVLADTAEWATWAWQAFRWPGSVMGLTGLPPLRFGNGLISGKENFVRDSISKKEQRQFFFLVRQKLVLLNPN